MKQKHPISFELKPGPILLACAAGVQGVQYAQAFALVHGHSLGQFALAGGWLAGTVVVGAVAFAGTRLPRLRAKSAQRWSAVFFYLLLTISPFILTPVNYYSMDAGLRAAIGGYAWVLAGLVASVPELALALVAFVDRDLLPGASHSAEGAGAVQAQSVAGAKSATQSGRSPAQVRRTAKESVARWPRKCEYCDALIPSPNGKGAHMKKHHPEKCARKAYAVPELLPAERDGER